MPAWEPALAPVLAEELAAWAEGPTGIAVITGSGVTAAGDPGPFEWASVTKLLTAITVLHAVDEGLVDLDGDVGPPGSTLRHLLGHASGLAFDSDRVLAEPGRRRIYSNRGFELAALHVAELARRPFPELVNSWLLEPLGMERTVMAGSPAYGARGPVSDLALLAAELLTPRQLSPRLLEQATRPSFSTLSGVLPGFGRHEPNAFGLGFEVRAHKSPHWTSPHNSATTFGHFGQAGSFLWVDPEAGVACVHAGSTPFGPWAADAWPRLSTAVLAACATPPSPAARESA